MLIARFSLIALVIATLVLLAAFIATRNRAYVQLLKQLYRYAAYFFGVLLVFYLISRVIRFTA